MALTELFSTQSLVWFRRSMLAFAAALGLAAIWILAPEILRATSVIFFADHPTPGSPPDRRASSCWAARLAGVRGDLWAQCALTYGERSGTDRQSNTQTSDDAEQAVAAAARAVLFAPHQSKLWLFLVGTEARLDWLNRKAPEALKMAYYMGPNEVELIPSRLLASMQFDMLDDLDIQQLVRNDIRTIITRAPHMKPAIVAAYRHALPQGKRFIEASVGDVDPGLVPELQSERQRP